MLVERGFDPPPDPAVPSMFSFAQPGRIELLLDAAGFAEWRVDAVDFAFDVPSFDDWWEHQYDDVIATSHATLDRLTPPAARRDLRRRRGRLRPYIAVDGSLRLPARTLVAMAEA